MMKLRLPVFFLAGLLILTACGKDDDSRSALDESLEATLLAASSTNNLKDFELPQSTNLSAIPQDPKNPLTPAKVALGRLLYHEAGLATDAMYDIGKETFSCASCHFASAGFQANRVQGIGDGGLGVGLDRDKSPMYSGDSIDVQPIRSPSTLNVAYQTNMLWNGQFGATGVNVGTESQWTVGTPKEINALGYEGVEVQAIAGLEVHRMSADTAFIFKYGYDELFETAFPGISEDRLYTREFVGLAIAAYERTLLPNQAPFQEWLKGDEDAMRDDEKRGAILFFGKAACANCHTGPALSSMEFHAYGMKDLFECAEEVFRTSMTSVENKGRGGFTGVAADDFKFKVPQLYNLSDSPFFGHGSSFRSIRDVVAYKNAGQAENNRVPASQLAEDFKQLLLTDQEVDDITAFLTHALHDDNLQRFEPNELPSGLCFPFNDPISKTQLGCQ